MTKMNMSPKHGTTTDTPESQSQPDGTAAEAPRGETQAPPNPSAPTQATEISNAQTKGAPLNDTFGEAGDPHGRGNLQVPEQTVDSSKSQNANFVGNPPTDKKPPTERANVKRKDEEEAA